MRFKKSHLLFGSILSLSLISSSFASVCDPSVGGAITTDYAQKVSVDKEAIGELEKLNKAAIDSSQDSYSCSDIWQSPNVSISFQKVQDLIKKAGEQLVSKACTAARDKINDAVSSASKSVSLNTSNIEGLRDLGIGNYSIASASSSTSSGSGSVSVNGSNTTMSDISKLLK
ncbi:hypothetical protein ACPUEX_22445 [Enterobacter vonholyi]